MSYQTPRGTYDIMPEDTGKWLEMEQLIRDVCRLYRYREIRTPIFEDTSVFKRENDSSDMVNKEMYTFAMGDESYTLRPEGTAGVIRSFDQHKLYGASELPSRLYYLGPMFRHERPQKGRQRQFTQFGIESIGAKSPEIDAEAIALGIEIVRRMGISSVKVCINTLGDDASRQAYREALKAYFTPHISSLCPDCHRRLEQNPLRILDCKADAQNPILHEAPRLSDYLNEESRTYFQKVLDTLDALGIPYEIDDRLVRGLDYYTHTVFEVKSTRPDSGAQATIFAGGRYDHLVEYFGGPELSGMGFAIGLERLISLAQDEGWTPKESSDAEVYVMSVGDTGTKPLEIGTQLRNEGIVADVNLLPRSMKAQFKSADRSNARVIIIVGEEELKTGAVNVKDKTTNTQTTVALEQLSETVKEILKK
ncbi:MAG: histidine--tRNA ligase [Solobacterium sp.]|nr:histidine--tRNA ligase [Solobacterium sp.]